MKKKPTDCIILIYAIRWFLAGCIAFWADWVQSAGLILLILRAVSVKAVSI